MASLRDKVAEVARRIGAQPDDLWHVIYRESAASPKAVGQKIKKGDKDRKPGVGLIQFMPETAIGLGTTQEDLLKMTPEQQLTYVEKYFREIKDRHKLASFNLRQLYASVLTGNPHAPLTASDGYTTVGKVVKEIEAKQKAEGGKKPVVESIIDKLYGEKKEDPKAPAYNPDVGPLRPEVAKQKAKEIEQQQTPKAPERPWHERLQFDAGNIAEKTVEQAKDMGMNVGDGEKVEQDDNTADRAAWEFMYPDKPMPEGWTVEGEIRRSLAETESKPVVRPRSIWAEKYLSSQGKSP